jgi:hypothetical protein
MWENDDIEANPLGGCTISLAQMLWLENESEWLFLEQRAELRTEVSWLPGLEPQLRLRLVHTTARLPVTPFLKELLAGQILPVSDKILMELKPAIYQQWFVTDNLLATGNPPLAERLLVQEMPQHFSFRLK